MTLAEPGSDPIGLAVRLFALCGYLMLTIAALMTPFLREISQAFGKPFLRIHHVFAAAGTVSVTLHPVSYAIQTFDMTVFVPSFASWYDFWRLAGRPALLLLYVAAVFALVRRRTLRFWRPFHAIAYIVLLFGVVHAYLSGTDFQNLAIVLLFSGLFVGVMLAFASKRYRNYQIRRKSAKRRAQVKS
jgi:DMSO/TMAO reductase YedYZ heme-binding membrane subunit